MKPKEVREGLAALSKARESGQRFSHIVMGVDGFQGIEHREGVEIPFSATWPLFLIGQAQRCGCDFEELADGYGVGEGTHGDWSGIRDSTFEAITRMTQKALNYLFSVDEDEAHRGKVAERKARVDG